jgi:ABC-type lipoprotein export system ATPase subunit
VQPIVSVENVSKTYDRGKVTALYDTTLTIPRGEFTFIVGPSGSGKSTFMNLLCGLDQPTTGRVLFEGKTPVNGKEWARLRAERIGFVFQSFNLLPTLTALENVQIPLFEVRQSAKKRYDRSIELLTRVGLIHRAKHHPNELSVGERQRVAIARSLANSPDLILADEPTGSLDSRSSADIMGLLEDIQKAEKLTLVIVTHDLELTKIGSRLIKIMDGRIE